MRFSFFWLTISLLNVLISKEASYMEHLTEEQLEELRKFIIDGKHHLYEEAVNFFNGEVDNKKLRYSLRKTRWFIEFRMCKYCRKEMIVCRDFTERKYCCKEHRILYHNACFNRHIKICDCEYCGEEFYPYTYRRGRFCSRLCAALYREDAKRKKKESK